MSDYPDEARTEIEALLPADVTSVLEIGCHAGATMRWLRTRRTIAYAAAVELMSEPARLAASAFDEIEVADIASAQLTFSHERFDLILALDVLEHLLDPAAALRRLHGRLAQGGTLIVSLPNVAHYHVAAPLLLQGRWDYTPTGLLDRTHLRFFTRHSAAALLEDAGFQVRVITANRLTPNIFALFGLHSPRWRWYSSRLLRWPRHLFEYQILLSATR